MKSFILFDSKTTMKNSLPLSLVIFLSLFFHTFVKGQTPLESQFLQKVGILDSLYSENLDEYRYFYVQFPYNYNSKASKKYPVAFVLDGEVFLPTVDNVLDFYSGGFTPEMIVIGISNAEHRTRDLTTSEVKEMYGMPFPEETGGAANFLNFIEKELIPFVEKKYPVTNYRTLIGHSYGGLFTVYTLINHPYLFSNYLAIDPSLDWDDQKLLQEAEEVLATNNYEHKALFMSLSGQLHMQNSSITIDNVMQDSSDYTLFARSNIEFSNLVEKNAQNGLTFNWKFYPNDLHGTVPFPSIMDGLISNFTWFQMENTDKINSFDTPKEELFKIIKNRERKLKAHFGYAVPPYPEDLMNMSGYMNMDMQKPEKAKIYFELAMDYFPQSPNVYDSMAEYYERNKEYKKALNFVTKAYEISKSDYYKQRIEKLKEQLKRN